MNAISIPRPPTMRQLAKQETQRLVLEGARELFIQKGYDGTTMRDLAGLIDRSTGAIFANFSGKDDLFRAVLAEDAEKLLAAMAAMVRCGTAEYALRSVIKAALEHYEPHRAFLRAKLAVAMTQSPAIRQQFSAERKTVTSFFLRIAEQDFGIDRLRATDVSDLLYAVYMQSLVSLAQSEIKYDLLTDQVKRHVGIVIRGR
jgi:AcrR family transcriptional regulator